MYHDPVLLQQCIDGLQIKSDGTYVDVTFGGGGHSRVIVSKLSDGHLYAFDQDADAHENELPDKQFTLIKQNFRYLKNNLRMFGAVPIDGLLADLGVSSHQFDEGSRGFSIRFDGDLDMRMDQSQLKSAKQVVNEYEEEQLADLFYQYGELKQSRKIARKIVEARRNQEIQTVEELKAVLASIAPYRKENQFFAQIFQSIRIEVNEELDALKEMLEQAAEVLKPGGLLVVISYHSLEDRLVKNFMRTGNFSGKQEKDFFGKLIRPLEPVNRKVIIPTDEEIERNSRARSAKLRIAVKNGE